MDRWPVPDSRGAVALAVELPPRGDGERLHLELPAVAGICRLRLDGAEIGQVGPSWTPLRVPLDEARGGERLELEVAPPPAGWPFAGFLPEVGAAPRGLWQGAFLARTGPAFFFARPRLRWRRGEAELDAVWDGPDDTELAVDAGEPVPWSPAEPRCGRITVRLLAGGRESDRAVLPAAARALRADGERLLLGGEPFRVRGLLHWGLYPELPGPDPEPDDLRRELREMRARGFNLLKCCLWIPPERFLAVCDEEGMPVWLEYPLWNRPLGRGLAPAYEEFLAHDAPHPCVVLRTFTCENDQRDARAAREIAGLVRELAPGTLCADNSGWLGHAHVADFDDEHPYLHPAQWPWYLERLRAARAARPRRPLLLGETMAADAVDEDSARLARAVRRDQAERLVRAFPEAGYVICGARDAPRAPLGLQDAAGRWKDPPEEWSWQVELAGGPPAAPWRPPEPPPAPDLPPGVEVSEVLDAPTLARLRAGARVLHPAGPRHDSWRTPEWLFWSWIPRLTGPAAAEPLRSLLLDHLPFGLLSGRRLARHPGALVVCGLEDRHDADPAAPPAVMPLVLAARVGRGRLLVSSLRQDSPAGRFVHAALAATLLGPAEPEIDLPTIELAPAPPAVFLDGPWRMDDRSFRTGTMRANEGANATWGKRSVRGTLPAAALAALPPGPATLHAWAVADGWELRSGRRLLHRHGNPGRTWDAGRDRPAAVELPAELLARAAADAGLDLRWTVHDHRGAGVMVGPIWLTAGPPAPLGPLA